MQRGLTRCDLFCCAAGGGSLGAHYFPMPYVGVVGMIAVCFG